MKIKLNFEKINRIKIIEGNLEKECDKICANRFHINQKGKS
jgi:hypothetical protein